MSKRKCICLIFAASAAAILFNLFLFGKFSCSGEYIHGTDIFGNEYLERRDTVVPADRILSGYDTDDYPELKEKLTAEKNSVNEYIAAYEYKYSDFDMSVYQNVLTYSKGSQRDWTDNVLDSRELSYEQAKKRYEQLNYCISRLNYVLDYKYYTKYVSGNSDKLLNLSLLDNNSFSAKNALKTKRDFYGLESVMPTAESDIGIISLFSDSVTDIISVIFAVCAAAVVGGYMKKQTFLGETFLLSVSLTVMIGTAIMYICNVALTVTFIGPINFLRPIQSVQSFKTSSLIMNVGTLTVIRILFKTAACSCVFFAAAGIITSSKRYVPIVTALIFILTELILAVSDTVFAKVNFFNFFRPEKIFGVYENLNIFGNAVSPQPVFIFSGVVIFSVSMIFSICSALSGALSAKEAAEHEYYIEVGRKYEETRKIRHDINNHLTALGILINEDKIAEAKAYLSEISAELSAQKPPAATGRPVLDALLFGKAQTAANCGVKLEITFDAVFSEKISDYDLCGIFGNVLDNAVEACEKYDGQRFIRLDVKKQMDMLCIFCENPYSSAELSPALETSKPDKSSHGYGIRRIEQLAAKHGGMVKISASNNLFSVSILIQN